MKRKYLFASFVVLATLAGTSMALAASFSNGSFENGTSGAPFSTLNAGNTSINNWNIDTGIIDYINGYWPASNGSKSIDLNGTAAGKISQTFDTVYGAKYVVSFDLSGNPDGKNLPNNDPYYSPALKTVEVKASGSAPALYNYDVVVENNSLSDMKWKNQTYNFTANSTSTTLSFESKINGAFGPALDNVVITQLPREFTTETIVVYENTSLGENLPGWMFARDIAHTTPFEFNKDAASIGMGSLYVKPIGPTPAHKFIAENFLNKPINEVNSISYDFKIGNGGDNTKEEHFYMNVYANFGSSDDLKFYDCRYNIVPTIGSTAGFTTVVFDPTQPYSVTTRTGSQASPHACPAVPADMDLFSPGSNIRAFALNVGDTSANDLGLDGYLDKVVVDTYSKVTTYDFDPEPTTKEMCKKNGWKNMTDHTGRKFKNQGDCVSYHATGFKNLGSIE